MLTRYEEYVIKKRDHHDRFPANESLAFKENFLMRPIVNEYVEMLWAAMKRLWPWLQRKKRKYRVIPTHDVDSPILAYDRSWSKVLKGCAGDLIKRRDHSIALKRLSAKLFGRYTEDPAYTFDFIMDISEIYGLTSEFYFMVNHQHPRYDTFYDFEAPYIVNALERIRDRCHVLGLHASYNS